MRLFQWCNQLDRCIGAFGIILVSVANCLIASSCDYVALRWTYDNPSSWAISDTVNVELWVRLFIFLSCFHRLLTFTEKKKKKKKNVYCFSFTTRSRQIPRLVPLFPICRAILAATPASIGACRPRCPGPSPPQTTSMSDCTRLPIPLRIPNTCGPSRPLSTLSAAPARRFVPRRRPRLRRRRFPRHCRRRRCPLIQPVQHQPIEPPQPRTQPPPPPPDPHLLVDRRLVELRRRWSRLRAVRCLDRAAIRRQRRGRRLLSTPTVKVVQPATPPCYWMHVCAGPTASRVTSKPNAIGVATIVPIFLVAAQLALAAAFSVLRTLRHTLYRICSPTTDRRVRTGTTVSAPSPVVRWCFSWRARLRWC